MMEEILDKYSDRLLRVFQYYCSFGEPLNTHKLKSSKFLKFLKEGDLLSKSTFKSFNNTKDERKENINYQNTQNH